MQQHVPNNDQMKMLIKQNNYVDTKSNMKYWTPEQKYLMDQGACVNNMGTNHLWTEYNNQPPPKVDMLHSIDEHAHLDNHNVGINHNNGLGLHPKHKEILGDDFHDDFKGYGPENNMLLDSLDADLDPMMMNMNNNNCHNMYKNVFFNTIRAKCPEQLCDEICQDLQHKMDDIRQGVFNGSYNEQNTIKKADYLIRQQQVKNTIISRRKRINNLISVGVNTFDIAATSMNMTWFDTTQFRELVDNSIDNNEFDECVTGLANMKSSTFLDHPVIGVVTTLLKNALIANNKYNNNKQEDEQKKSNPPPQNTTNQGPSSSSQKYLLSKKQEDECVSQYNKIRQNHYSEASSILSSSSQTKSNPSTPEENICHEYNDLPPEI